MMSEGVLRLAGGSAFEMHSKCIGSAFESSDELIFANNEKVCANEDCSFSDSEGNNLFYFRALSLHVVGQQYQYILSFVPPLLL
jgi:hypothetical protein